MIDFIEKALLKREDQDYFNDKTRVSASDIKTYYKNPCLYHNKVELKQTPDIKLGTAIHKFFLEDKTEDIVLPPQKKQIFEKIKTKHAYLFNHEDFKESYKERVVEFSLEKVDCKAKIDIINTKKKFIIDIKTISKIESMEFMKKYISNYLYRLQLRFYQLALGKIEEDINRKDVCYKTYLLFLEKNEPFNYLFMKIDFFYQEDKMIQNFLERKRKNRLKNNLFEDYFHLNDRIMGKQYVTEAI